MAYFTQRDFASPQFEPLTLAQYTKPFEDYAKVYYNIADKYSELGSMSGALETMLNNPNDVNAYNRLLDYNNRLQTEVNDFLDKGLTPYNNRYSDMLKYRNEYNTQFAPLIKDVERRKELVDSQQQMVLNAAARGDNSLIFDVDYNKASVDWVHDHPGHTYKVISLNGVTSDAAAQAEKLSKVFRNLSLQSPFTDDVDLMVKESGLSAMDLLNLDNPSYDHYYDARLVKAREIYDMVVERSGIYGFAGSPNYEGKLRQVQIAAKEGLAQALGVTDFTPLTNYTGRRGSGAGEDIPQIANISKFSNSNLYKLTDEGKDSGLLLGKSLEETMSNIEKRIQNLPEDVKNGIRNYTVDDNGVKKNIVVGYSFKDDYDNKDLTVDAIDQILKTQPASNNAEARLSNKIGNLPSNNDYTNPIVENERINKENKKTNKENNFIGYLQYLKELKVLKGKGLDIYNPDDFEKIKYFLTDAYMSANMNGESQKQLADFLSNNFPVKSVIDKKNDFSNYYYRDGDGKWNQLGKDGFNAFIDALRNKKNNIVFDVSGLTDNIANRSIVIEIKPGATTSKEQPYEGPDFVSLPLTFFNNLSIYIKGYKLNDYLEEIKKDFTENKLDVAGYNSAINNVIVALLNNFGQTFKSFPEGYTQKQSDAIFGLMQPYN